MSHVNFLLQILLNPAWRTKVEANQTASTGVCAWFMLGWFKLVFFGGEMNFTGLKILLEYPIKQINLIIWALQICDWIRSCYNILMILFFEEITRIALCDAIQRLIMHVWHIFQSTECRNVDSHYHIDTTWHNYKTFSIYHSRSLYPWPSWSHPALHNRWGSGGCGAASRIDGHSPSVSTSAEETTDFAHHSNPRWHLPEAQVHELRLHGRQSINGWPHEGQIAVWPSEAGSPRGCLE